MTGQPALQRQPLPTGLRLRPYAGESDIPAIVAIENAESEADGIPERTSEGEKAADFRHASAMFDAVRDVTLAEVEGAIVAVAFRSWVDTADGELREYRMDGSVHPNWRRRGIGAGLLSESEARLRELAASHVTDRRKVFGSWSSDRQAGDIALLQSSGFGIARWFFEMTRPTLDDIPQLRLPDGLQVRPMTPELVYPVWRGLLEAFLDHWGGHDDSDEALLRYMDMPEWDPSLWVIAFDGEEVAGGVVNTIYPFENEALGLRRGWLDSVFTRRPWRKRGLARALISLSLERLRERGMTSAVLGVDAENPSGALGLYESTGFEVDERSMAWRKRMDGA